MTSQRRENNGEHERVHENRLRAGLSRTKNTTRSRWKGQKETRAQREEERRGHKQISLRDDQAHHARNQGVDQEEHESVEEDGHLVRLTVGKLDRLSIRCEQKTWAERNEKRGRDGDFTSRNIGEHLVYAYIILWRV